MVASLIEQKFRTLRQDFAIFNSDQPIHYLDSAATSQVPAAVIDVISNCYRNNYSPVHRGLYPSAELASENYENSRQTLANFINSEFASSIIFTRSATEAINLVAMGWAAQQLQTGDEVCVTQMEHHSNFLPWQRICAQRGAKLRVIPFKDNGTIDLETVATTLTNKTRLIAITQVSNVFGAINPIKEIIAQANSLDIPVLVDAAQSIGHLPINVKELGCDFLVASAHKMCGPAGIGMLYARPELLDEMEPMLLGGGMVDEVQEQSSSWSEVPACFEAGSPNLSGAMGFSAAANYINLIGRELIADQVAQLTALAYKKLSMIPGVTIYGPKENSHRSGILSFNIQGVHPHDVAHIAGEHQVAIRAGHHCCQPLMDAIGVSSTARASLYFYNNEEDVVALEESIYRVKEIFSQ